MPGTVHPVGHERTRTIGQVILDGLSPEQRDAVTHASGPMLVVAGAGSGKTRVLTHRVAWLVENGAHPDEIVALTFSSRAADELRSRAEALLGRAHDTLRVLTFHAFAGELARVHGVEHGLLPPAVWATEEERALIMLDRIGELGLLQHDLRGGAGRVVDDIIRRIERCKNELVTAEDFVGYAKMALDEASTAREKVERTRDLEFAHAYLAHDRWLAEEGLVDFGEGIVRAVKVLRGNPERLTAVREGIRHVLVDEFQDTDFAQSQLLYLIGDGAESLMAVGDDDQGIYRFRGASTKNILDFRARYPNRREIKLERNHRSTQSILDAAHALVEPLPGRADKHLVALEDATGPMPRFWIARDEDAQARAVAEAILTYQAEGIALEEQAILMDSVRTEAPAFVRVLEAAGIPHQVHGGLGLFERREVREVMAWLRALADPDDPQAHLRLAGDLGLPWADSTDAVHMAGERTETATMALARVARSVGRPEFELILNAIGPAIVGPPADLVRTVLDLSGVRERALALGGAEGAARLAGLAEFERLGVELADRDPQIDGTTLVHRLVGLSEVGHRGSVPRSSERTGVQVSTIHQSKGLEFDAVFVVGLVAARVPGRDRRGPDIPDALLPESLERGRDAHVAEKRRLFYVALTRARRHLVLSTYEQGERNAQKPSPFFDEARAAVGDPEPDHVGEGPERVILDAIAHARRDLEAAVRTAARTRTEGGDEVTARQEIDARIETLLEAQTQAFDPPRLGPAALRPPNPSPPSIDISPSDLQAYRTCPLRYRFAKVDRVPSVRRPSGSVGTALHLALEAHFRPGGPGGDGDALVTRFADQLERLGVADTPEGQQAMTRAREHLPAYHAKMTGRGYDGIIKGVERRFTLPLGRHTVHGRVDRMDLRQGSAPGFQTIDYKSGKPPSHPGVGDEDIVLALYMKAVIDNGAPCRGARLDYVLDGGDRPFDPTPGELAVLVEEAEMLANAAADRRFDPTPGFHCRSCDYQLLCPERDR